MAFTALPPAAHAQTQPAAPAAATAPAAPAAPAAPVAKAPEVIENPYGLEALWKGGDLVAKTTLAILFIMSMGSWYIIITKLYEQSKMRRQATDAEKKFWKAAIGRARVPTIAEEASPFRFIAEAGHRGDEEARRPARQDRPEQLDHDVDPARHRKRAKPHAGRPRVPGHRRFDGAVRGPVRHGLGHLPRADRDRHRRPGLDRQGRRARSANR